MNVRALTLLLIVLLVRASLNGTEGRQLSHGSGSSSSSCHNGYNAAVLATSCTVRANTKPGDNNE